MASALLQLNPEDRVGAENGLLHPYFAQLPKKLYELPDGEFKLLELSLTKILMHFPSQKHQYSPWKAST